MITFVSGIMNRHVVCTMVKIITAHPVYVRWWENLMCKAYIGKIYTPQYTNMHDLAWYRYCNEKWRR
jgi:hypothetical protein